MISLAASSVAGATNIDGCRSDHPNRWKESGDEEKKESIQGSSAISAIPAVILLWAASTQHQPC